jgi:hypothetical protein
MPLAPGQKSLKVSRLGVMRLGTSRLGWYQPWIKLYINGVLATRARVDGATITDELNHEPNTASFNVSGIVPLAGQSVAIQCGDTDLSHQLFGGRIIAVNKTYEAEKPANVIYTCRAIDPTWLLNRRKVFKKYTNQSATAIALDVISSFTSGVTTVHVVAGLPTIDEITFTAEDVTDALTRITERIGGYWYIDYTGDVHLFLSESIAAYPITTAAPRGMAGIASNTDLSQIATRVLCSGAGSSALFDTAAGSTVLPVEAAVNFSTSGGTLKIGHQRVTYTGKNLFSRAATLTRSGSTVSSGSSEYPILPGDTFTISGANEPEYNGTFVANVGSGGTTFIYTITGTPASPATGTITVTMDVTGRGSTVVAAAAARDTSLAVEDGDNNFSYPGWALADGQLISFTGASAGPPNRLQGIPTSGLGSIVTPIAIGASVVNAAVLTGIPASGAGAIADPVHAGDAVDLLVTAEDTAAQTALAALVGGDGVSEMYISDGRLSVTEATARANAELSLERSARDGVLHQPRSVDAERARRDADDHVTEHQRHAEDSARHDHRARAGRGKGIHLPAAPGGRVEPSLLVRRFTSQNQKRGVVVTVMSIVFTLHNGSIVRCESAGGHDAWTPKLLLDAFATAVAELSGRPADGVKVNVALDAADRVVFTADIPEGRIQSEPMTLPADVVAQLGLWQRPTGKN